jgi:AraC family transcriptional regulator
VQTGDWSIGMQTKISRQTYLLRINRVIDHIRDHLTEPLSLERLARVAHFSPYHFHRIFRALVGEPVHVFVRRLRLEKALYSMVHGPKRTLTQIALANGFASSSDFSRAFRQAYGFSPREHSRERFLQESKIRQDLLANAGYNFGKLPDVANPDGFRVRLLDRPAERIAYVRIIGGYVADKIIAGLNRLLKWGNENGLIPGGQLIGMSQDDPDITPMSKYRFDWCIVIPRDMEPGRGINTGRISANRFASLHCQGDIYKVDRAWRYLFQAWLPASGYQPTHDPAMEVFHGDAESCMSEAVFDIDCRLPVKPLGSR